MVRINAIRMKTLPLFVLGAFAASCAIASDAARYAFNGSIERLVRDEKSFTHFATKVLHDVERRLHDEPSVEVTRQRLLLRIRVHAALYLGDQRRVRDTVTRIRALVSDPVERTYSGLSSLAYLFALQHTGEPRPQSARFAAAFQEEFDRGLARLPDTVQVRTILGRQRASFAAISEADLLTAAAALGARLDAAKTCNIEEADRIVQIGHRLVDIVPLRSVMLQSLDAALAGRP